MALAGWHPDPTGRNAARYFDGLSWTDHVATPHGEQSRDPVLADARAVVSRVTATEVIHRYDFPHPGSRDYAETGYIRAGWWRRVGSSTIDQLILGVPGVVVAAMGGARASHFTDAANVQIALAITFLVVLAEGVYSTLLVGQGRGRTVGNLALGIVARTETTGELLSFRTAFIRWFVRRTLFVLVLPGLLNDLWPLWDKKKQSLADKVAGTVMVRQL